MPDVFQQEHASTDQLSALLDNRAEPAEAPFLTQHLGSCDACAAELGSLRGVRDLLRALPVHLPPRSFTIQEDPIPLRPSRLIPITRVLGALAAVFCAILVAMDALGTTNPQTAPLAGLSVPSQSDTAAKPAAAGGAVRSEAPAPAPAAPAPQPQIAARAAAPTATAATTAAFAPTAPRPAAAQAPAAAGASQAAPPPAATAVPPPPESAKTSGQPVANAPAASGRDAPSMTAAMSGLPPLRAAWLALGVLALLSIAGSFIAGRRAR